MSQPRRPPSAPEIASVGARTVATVLQREKVSKLRCKSQYLLPISTYVMSHLRGAPKCPELREQIKLLASVPASDRPNFTSSDAIERVVSWCAPRLERMQFLMDEPVLPLSPTALMMVLVDFVATGTAVTVARVQWSYLKRLATADGKPSLANQVAQDFTRCFHFLPFKTHVRRGKAAHIWFGEPEKIERIASSPGVIAFGDYGRAIAIIANAFKLPLLAAAAIRLDLASNALTIELVGLDGNDQTVPLSVETTRQRDALMWLHKHKHLLKYEGKLFPDFACAKKVVSSFQDELVLAGVLPADTDWFFQAMTDQQITELRSD